MAGLGTSCDALERRSNANRVLDKSGLALCTRMVPTRPTLAKAGAAGEVPNGTEELFNLTHGGFT